VAKTEPLQNHPTDVAHLQQELQLRDQLVQQLSQELFRLVKGQDETASVAAVDEQYQAEVQQLREQFQEVEQQVVLYQRQLAQKDQEISQLRQSVRELGDRSRRLEQILQELPSIYRQKFAGRMAAVRDKVEKLQRENRQLHAELQSVSYRLAVKNRRHSLSEIELPTFNPQGGSPIPTFSPL
jgi:chromosome segregation ATPase